MEDGLLTPFTREGDYKQWACQVEALLILADRLDKLLTREPDGSEEELERDIVCKARLTLYVSGALRGIVVRADTAKAAWDALQEEYLWELRARKPKLKADLANLSQGGGSVVDYIDRVKERRDQFEELEMLESLPRLCRNFIRGLDRETLQICGPMLSTMLLSKDVGLDELCSALSHMASFLPGRGHGEVRAARGEGPHTRRCYYCGMAGHLKKDCHKRESDRKGSWGKRQVA
jgi:hypothetical protein